MYDVVTPLVPSLTELVAAAVMVLSFQRAIFHRDPKLCLACAKQISGLVIVVNDIRCGRLLTVDFTSTFTGVGRPRRRRLYRYLRNSPPNKQLRMSKDRQLFEDGFPYFRH
jgi:hypothetical protein